MIYLKTRVKKDFFFTRKFVYVKSSKYKQKNMIEICTSEMQSNVMKYAEFGVIYNQPNLIFCANHL